MLSIQVPVKVAAGDTLQVSVLPAPSSTSPMSGPKIITQVVITEDHISPPLKVTIQE